MPIDTKLASFLLEDDGIDVTYVDASTLLRKSLILTILQHTSKGAKKQFSYMLMVQIFVDEYAI